MKPLTLFVVLGWLCLIGGAAAAEESRPYVTLGGGWIDQHHKYGWAFFARRPAPPEGNGPHGAQRPCIAVSAVRRVPVGIRVRERELCYGFPGYLTATAEPLIVGTVVFDSDKGSATAFALAASAAARQMVLVLPSGARAYRLHRLNQAQAHKARLKPFRYVGFVMRGDWCIQQILLRNQRGDTLWDSGEKACSSGGEEMGPAGRTREMHRVRADGRRSRELTSRH